MLTNLIEEVNETICHYSKIKIMKTSAANGVSKYSQPLLCYVIIRIGRLNWDLGWYDKQVGILQQYELTCLNSFGTFDSIGVE